MDKFEKVIISLAAVTVFIVAFNMPADEELAVQQQYCEMVDIWQSQENLPPEQRNGHPDYRGDYEQSCH